MDDNAELMAFADKLEKATIDTIEANDFLHNMQRLIIGTLIDIGLEKRPVSDIRAIFRGEESASLPCDPKGMYLQEIQY